jgi:hypothetical protein
MALSDQLRDLADRAKKLEDRAAAAKQKEKAELETEVKNARDCAQADGDALRTRSEENKDRISAWWDKLQSTWNEQLKVIRKNADHRRAAHDLKVKQRAAQQADDDAAFAIHYAYAAMEEAEYAVLDAILAQKEADEFAQAQSRT